MVGQKCLLGEPLKGGVNRRRRRTQPTTNTILEKPPELTTVERNLISHDLRKKGKSKLRSNT